MDGNTRHSSRPISDSSASPPGPRYPSKFRATLWGVVLILLGLFLEAASIVGWADDKWSDVSVSVGASALLAGFVMFLEPRLVRDVGQAASTATAGLAASTATEVAARIATDRTRELDERLSRVEGIREVQDRVRAQRKQAATQLAKRLRAGVPDYSHVEELLADADSRLLFDDLWLRCGNSNNLLLSFRILQDVKTLGRSIFVCLGKTSTRPLLRPGVSELRGKFPDMVTISEWRPDESFEVAYQRFDEACEQVNQSTQDMDFESAFISLSESYELMVHARDSQTTDAIRLAGRLTLRINEEWAIMRTSIAEQAGTYLLVGLLSEHQYSTWPLGSVKVSDPGVCPDAYDLALWEEAVRYAKCFLRRAS